MNDARPVLVSIGEFALGVSVRLGTRDWSALLVPNSVPREPVARTLVQEIKLHAEVDVALVELSEGFLARLLELKVPVVVAFEGAPLARKFWTSLDLDRSVLPHGRVVALTLSESSFVELEREAPNLASWMGANVSSAAIDTDTLSEDERERVLAGLREKFKMSDAEMLMYAAAGRAPDEPDIALWLVLLGKGELLGSR